MPSAASAPHNNLFFTAQDKTGTKNRTTSALDQSFYGNLPPQYSVGPAGNADRKPPVEGETYFNDATNPQPFVKIPAIEVENGDARASSTMAFSMSRTRKGVITAPKPLPRTHNTNAAPVFLRAYGPSGRGSNDQPPERSVFGVGGGAPIALGNQKNRDAESGRV
jgi:hypothetical protein